MPLTLPTAAEAARLPWHSRGKITRAAARELRNYTQQGHATDTVPMPPIRRYRDEDVTRCGCCGGWMVEKCGTCEGEGE